MKERREQIAAILSRVRARWRAVTILRAWAVAAGAAARVAGLRAAAATLVLLVLCGFAAGPVTRAAQLFAVYLFPDRLGLQVVPGDAKVRAGEPLRIIARLPGAVSGV